MNFYLNKYGFCPPQIKVPPLLDLELIIVIPCFNEPDLIRTLTSICHSPPLNFGVEVIVVINAAEEINDVVKRANQQSYLDFKMFISTYQREDIQFYAIFKDDLSQKHAGVGLARKIGMDEAVHRFEILQKDGIIVCFDADSECRENYLEAIHAHFMNHPKSPGASIYFEHPISGNEFTADVYEGIINYELHLRYYNQALKWCGLPFAFHTVGSSMAVRSSAYQKQGGMNKRKAGEDFYFIHKIIALGGFTEIKSTAVIPSPRISDRVPFGTGRAIGEWVERNTPVYLTYNFNVFGEIKAFVNCVPDFYLANVSLTKFSPAFQDFLRLDHFEVKLNEMKMNTKNSASFTKRFYTWFDAFKVLKLIHFLRDNGFPQSPLIEEVDKFIGEVFQHKALNNSLEQLNFLREIEKK